MSKPNYDSMPGWRVHRSATRPVAPTSVRLSSLLSLLVALFCTAWLILFLFGCTLSAKFDGLDADSAKTLQDAAPVVGAAVGTAVGTAVGGPVGGPVGGAVGGLIGQIATGLIGVAGAADSMRQRKRRGQVEAEAAILRGREEGWEQNERERLTKRGIVATTTGDA